jgi:hypothetical protein
VSRDPAPRRASRRTEPPGAHRPTVPAAVDGGTGRRGDDPVVDLLDRALLDQAVADRQQRDLLVGADREDTTLRAALHALAEHRAGVRVRTLGPTLTGRLTGVGSDHLQMAGARGPVLVAQTALLAVVRVDHVPAPSDDRSHPSGDALLAVVGALADDSPEVEVHLAGGHRLSGELLPPGRDLVRLRSVEGEVLVPEAALVALSVILC